jgi:hypothetical protein
MDTLRAALPVYQKGARRPMQIADHHARRDEPARCRAVRTPTRTAVARTTLAGVWNGERAEHQRSPGARKCAAASPICIGRLAPQCHLVVDAFTGEVFNPIMAEEPERAGALAMPRWSSPGCSIGPRGRTDPDDVPDPPAHPVTRPGDLWLLGANVTCPNCRKRFQRSYATWRCRARNTTKSQQIRRSRADGTTRVDTLARCTSRLSKKVRADRCR